MPPVFHSTRTGWPLINDNVFTLSKLAYKPRDLISDMYYLLIYLDVYGKTYPPSIRTSLPVIYVLASLARYK